MLSGSRQPPFRLVMGETVPLDELSAPSCEQPPDMIFSPQKQCCTIKPNSSHPGQLPNLMERKDPQVQGIGGAALDTEHLIPAAIIDRVAQGHAFYAMMFLFLRLRARGVQPLRAFVIDFIMLQYLRQKCELIRWRKCD